MNTLKNTLIDLPFVSRDIGLLCYVSDLNPNPESIKEATCIEYIIAKVGNKYLDEDGVFWKYASLVEEKEEQSNNYE